MENCLICDSAENYLTSYPSGGVENPLQFTEIQTCYACEFGIALPYKNQDELDNFYQSGKYWDEGANISETLIAHNKNQAKHRVRKNRRFLLNQDGPIHILDVGAGLGHIAHWLFKELKNQEIHYHFIEPDNFSRNQILKEYSKYNVYHKKSEELKESQYDFIFLNHVLEHVENPMTFLDTYLRALKDIGHIYVETPNKDNLFKNSVFPHTLFFCMKSIQKWNSVQNIFDIQNIQVFGSKKSMSVKRRSSLFFKIITKIFFLSTKYKIQFLSELCNDWLFEYDKKSDALWLSWIVTKN